MKIDVKDLTMKIRSGDSVTLSKSVLEEDMRTIYDYYDSVEKPKFMKDYYSLHTNFKLIPFTSTYFSKLIDLPINVVINADIVTLSTSKPNGEN